MLLGTAAPALLLIAATVPAAAQDTAGAVQIETVVVTAQKVEQNIQRVPIAVTAYTAADLETKGITDVSNLSNATPNVTFDAGTPFSGSTAVLSAYIRGIGQNDFAFNQDPGVGVYLDGVYLARSVGANTDLLDVERVEVLKGPQGDLFGRNTIGGAVSIVTRDPGDEFAFKGEVTGGSYNRLDVRGYVDIPLTDDLSTSFSFAEKHQGGYLKRIPFPTSGPLYQQALAGSGLTTPGGDCAATPDNCPTITDPTTAGIMAGYGSSNTEGGMDEWDARIKAVWHARDDLKFTFAADYTNQDGPGQAMRPILINTNYSPSDLGGLYNTCISTPSAVLDTIGLGAICGPRGTAGSTYAPSGAAFAQRVAGTLAGVNVDGNPNNNRLAYGPWFVTKNIDTSYSTGNSFSKLKQYGAALTIDWNASENAHVKLISAYRGLHWSPGEDGDGSPLNIHELSIDIQQQQWSEELQFTGTTLSDSLDYVLGAYFFHEDGHNHDFVTFPGLLLQVDGQNLLSTTSWAGYFHLTYHLTDKLSLIAGGRYTRESKDFQGFQEDPNALVYKISGCYGVNGFGGTPSTDPITNTCRVELGFPDPNNPLRFYPPGVHQLFFDNFAPHAAIQYQVTDDDMLYATYQEGFKTGSWTTRLSAPHPTYDASLHFNPEKAKSGEIGWKSEFDDHRMRLNAAAFYTKYKGIQLNFQLGISPTLLNAGNASIWGGELEYTALLTDRLTVNASLGYIHAQYDDVTPGAGSNGVPMTTQTKLPKTPDWKFNISPEYTMPLKSGSLQFDLDYTYTSSLFNDTQNTPELARPATSMLNASVTYVAPGDHWELSVGGSNLTDDRYVVTGVNQGGIQVIYGSYNPPREWMATLRIRS